MAFFYVIRGGKTTGEVVDLLPSEALDYATSLGVGYALQEQSPVRNIIQSRLGSGEPLMPDAPMLHGETQAMAEVDRDGPPYAEPLENGVVE
jgi:hypothetical protein